MAFSSPSNDQRNFECVTVASVDFIKLPLKDILESLIQPVNLFKGINLCPALLSGKFKLRQDQLKLCFIQPKAIPDYSKFDVTLLYTLIRNLCPSLKPTKGWGKDPDDADIQIGDDIERLRLFRNNYHAHADSAAISDAEFKDIWKKLKTVVYRIQKYINNTGRNVNYEQELIKIESSRIAQDHLESCKLILQALMNIQKQTDLKDEPKIFLKVEDRVFCGDTARFEADVKNVEVSCWRSTWQKRTENSILKCIDTNQEKYKGSTNIILLIQNVSKEDEGEYQAVISRVANGIEYRLSSNIVYLHALGELPVLNDLRVTTGDEGITIHYSYKVLKQSPKVKHINWCKNGKPLDRKSKKYIGGSLNENCFTITSPTDDDRGTYKCTITNVVGSVSKEVIFGLPNTMASEETVIRNKSVKLVGNVFVYDGSPDILEVFWTKNGEKIDPQGSGGRLSAVTVDDPSLTIRDVGHIDAGEYKLIARNAVGTTSSDIIAIGTPNIYLERLENEGSVSQCFKATIKATPLPCSVQWSKKGNDEDEYKPIDADAEEFIGTTNYLPHPKLVVKDRTLLENNCFQIEVSNFIGSTVEKISDTKYQATLVCNLISSPGVQRVLLDCCIECLIQNLKHPNETWTKDKILTHVRGMINKLVEKNERDRLEYFCQNFYQDESLLNTLLDCGEDFYALLFSMEEKYNAQDIILSEGSFCVTFCFENNLYLENFLQKLESKDEQLIKDLSKLTLNKTLLKIFSISSQQVWWTAWRVKIYKGTQFFEKIFTYPIEGRSEDCSAIESEERSLLIGCLSLSTRIFLKDLSMNLMKFTSEIEVHQCILREVSESTSLEKMSRQLSVKLNGWIIKEQDSLRTNQREIRQHLHLLEDIEELETKERSRLIEKSLLATKNFIDVIHVDLENKEIGTFYQNYCLIKNWGNQYHDEKIYDLIGEFVEYCERKRIFVEGSLEKIRQFMESLEEIKEFETKDPEMDPEIAEQQLRKIRLSTERHRKLIEDLEKESVKRWNQTQDPEEYPETFTQKQPQRKSVEDVQKSKTKEGKLMTQTQDPEIDPKILEQQLRKMRLLTERTRKGFEDLKKGVVKPWSQAQDPEIDPEIAEQQLRKIRLLTESNRKGFEDLEKGVVKPWSPAQDPEIDPEIVEQQLRKTRSRTDRHRQWGQTQDPKEFPETFTQKQHLRKSVGDVEKSKIKGGKLTSQTKDPEIDPEIVEQLRKLRLSQKWNRKVSEDLAKERAKRWSQSQEFQETKPP